MTASVTVAQATRSQSRTARDTRSTAIF
jgi:hypothetical protein